jgi:hypothetical protein
MIRASVVALVLCVVPVLSAQTLAQSTATDSFNQYVLKAVTDLNANYGGKGYDIHNAYTHEIPYPNGSIKPSNAPGTMCVAAVAEVIITAINMYADQTGDNRPYNHLPVGGWNRMRPIDIRSHLWVDSRLDSYGTADTLVTFGVGKRVKFSELTPGSFVNINRSNRTGRIVPVLVEIGAAGAIG